MSAIELAPEIAEDFERILEHLVSNAADNVASRIQDIVRAIDVLERNPLIGRPAGDGLRELVIGRRSRGYVALYRYVDEIDTVFVLALRSQREAGQAQAEAGVAWSLVADSATYVYQAFGRARDSAQRLWSDQP